MLHLGVTVNHDDIDGCTERGRSALSMRHWKVAGAPNKASVTNEYSSYGVEKIVFQNSIEQPLYCHSEHISGIGECQQIAVATLQYLLSGPVRDGHH